MIPLLHTQKYSGGNDSLIGRLADCIRCEVREHLNGEYELELEYPLTGAHAEDLIAGRVIVAKPSYQASWLVYIHNQPFRIYDVTDEDGIRYVYAHHISYDLNMAMIYQFSATGVHNVLQHIEDNIVRRSSDTLPWEFTSDLTYVPTVYTVDHPMSVREVLGGTEGSVLDTFGGEFEWDEFTVKLLKKRSYSEFVVRYGVNLMSFEREENYDSSFTHVMVYYFNADLNQLVVSSAMAVSDLSQYASQINQSRTRLIDVTDQFEEAPVKADLDTLAQSYAADMSAAPAVGINVEVANLQAAGEETPLTKGVNLGDTVTIHYTPLNITTTQKVVETTWDVIQNRYTSVIVGTPQATLADTIADMGATSASGGGGGTGNYEQLNNLPSINGTTIIGALSLADIGAASVAALNNKVDKVTGMGLSTNDFTDAYKTKLEGISAGAEVNVQADWNVTDSSSDAYIKNKPNLVISTIEVNGSALTPSGDSVDVQVPVTNAYSTLLNNHSAVRLDTKRLIGSTYQTDTLYAAKLDSNGLIYNDNLPDAGSGKGAVSVVKTDVYHKYAEIGYYGGTIQLPWVIVDSNNNVTSKIRDEFIPDVDADDISYTNASLQATNVGDALDEIASDIGTVSGAVAGKIEAPPSPSQGDMLTYDGSDWVASANNSITTVKVNGTALTATNKTVDVPVPVTDAYPTASYTGSSINAVKLETTRYVSGHYSSNTLLTPKLDGNGLVPYDVLPAASSTKGAVTVSKAEPVGRYATIGFGNNVTVQVPWVAVDSNNNVTSKIRADFIPDISIDATDVAYDNSTASSFSSDNVQYVLDEVSYRLENLEEEKITAPASAVSGNVLTYNGTEWVAGSGGGGGGTGIQTVKVNGTALVPDANMAVDVSVPITAASLSGAGAADLFALTLANGTQRYFPSIGDTSSGTIRYSRLPDATSSQKGAVIVDTALSTSSTNPVRNSAVATGLNAKITAPSNPTTGAFLVWDGTAWVAQTLSTWQGGNY